MSAAQKCILLVDDEPFEGHLLLTRMEDPRCSHLRLQQVTSLPAALAAVRDATPDLILLDYTLRPHHFEESLAALRGAGFGGPVVLYTQLDGQLVRERRLDALASEYLSKDEATVERVLELIDRLSG
jgi:CheY-like chemotaxis protein